MNEQLIPRPDVKVTAQVQMPPELRDGAVKAIFLHGLTFGFVLGMVVAVLLATLRSRSA
jgi:hypothetical protein